MAPPPFTLLDDQMHDAGAEKRALRARMRQTRKACAAAQPKASMRLVEALAQAPVSDWRGRVVSVYLAEKSEIDPAPLAAHLAALGAIIVLPVVIAHGAPLIFRMAGRSALTPDAVGMLAPGPDAPQLTPEIVLAPLLAFDPYGARLGQGGGFYDRTLAALRGAGPVTAIGLAYAGQEVERLPVSPHDQYLDGVLTEEGYRAAFKP